jgi:hypothetical protein
MLESEAEEANAKEQALQGGVAATATVCLRFCK